MGFMRRASEREIIGPAFLFFLRFSETLRMDKAETSLRPLSGYMYIMYYSSGGVGFFGRRSVCYEVDRMGWRVDIEDKQLMGVRRGLCNFLKPLLEVSIDKLRLSKEMTGRLCSRPINGSTNTCLNVLMKN